MTERYSDRYTERYTYSPIEGKGPEGTGRHHTGRHHKALQASLWRPNPNRPVTYRASGRTDWI